MPIEVILQKQVPGLGSEADIVKVKSGYARNYLIPQNIAGAATEGSKLKIEELKKQRAQREADELNHSQELATALSKATATFQVQANEDGKKIFGSITNSDIAERLKTMDIEIDRHKIDLDKPLNALGDYEVKVNLPMGVNATLKVILEAKKAED